MDSPAADEPNGSTELVDPADDAALAAWLADEAPRKVLHDAKGPTLAAWARGWDLRGIGTDTLIAAYLLRPDQRTFDLADLTLRYLRRELALGGAAEPSAQEAFDFGGDDDVAVADALLRARVVLELAEVLQRELAERDEEDLLRSALDKAAAGGQLVGSALPLAGT